MNTTIRMYARGDCNPDRGITEVIYFGHYFPPDDPERAISTFTMEWRIRDFDRRIPRARLAIQDHEMMIIADFADVWEALEGWDFEPDTFCKLLDDLGFISGAELERLDTSLVLVGGEQEAADDAEVHYFGGCPECRGNSGYLNIGRSHWFVCHAHRTKWFVGSKLFSTWMDETEADWRRNCERIKDYREVEPIWQKEDVCD